MTEVKQISEESAIGKVSRGTPASQPKTAEEIKKEKTGEEVARKDSLQVNEKLREEATLVENARLLLDELPEVREDKIALARRRLAEGFYDKAEVIEKTAAKMVDEKNQDRAAGRVDKARNRLAEGYYEKPEVIDETARKIVRDIKGE
jgi:hypothetical protein